MDFRGRDGGSRRMIGFFITPQPVEAALARCPRQRKAKQRSADHEDDNDNYPPAQHHRGRFMVWYSDIGDRGADLVEQTDVLCRARSCGPRLRFPGR